MRWRLLNLDGRGCGHGGRDWWRDLSEMILYNPSSVLVTL